MSLKRLKKTKIVLGKCSIQNNNSVIFVIKAKKCLFNLICLIYIYIYEYLQENTGYN